MKQVEGSALAAFAASHEIMSSENSGEAPKSLSSLILRHFPPVLFAVSPVWPLLDMRKLPL